MAIPAVQHNTPSPGYITWAAFNIQYNGVSYAVPTGNTAERWVWWRYNGGGTNTVLEAGPDVPADLTDDDIVLFGNKNGLAVRIQSTSFIDGELIVDGTIVADALAANTITGDKLAANSVTADTVAANAIGADALAANIILTSRISAGGVPDDNGNLSGQRTEMSPDGLQAFDGSGLQTFKVSNDGSSHKLSGDADIDHLRTLLGASLGGSSEIAQDSLVTMQTGITPPAVPPTLTNSPYSTYYLQDPTYATLRTGPLGSFPSRAYTNDAYYSRMLGKGGYVDDSSNTTYLVHWLYDNNGYEDANNFLGSRITKYTHVPGQSAGTSALTWVSIEDFPNEYIIGYVERAGVVKARMLSSNTYPQASSVITVKSHNNAGGSEVSRTYTRSDTTGWPGFGWDSVNNQLCIGEWVNPFAANYPVNNIVVKRWGVGAAADGTTWASGGTSITARVSIKGLQSVHFGRFDFTEDCFVFSNRYESTQTRLDNIHVFPGTNGSSAVRGRKFYTPQRGSLGWDGQVFRVIADTDDAGGYINVHSKEWDESTNGTVNELFFEWWVGLSYVVWDSATSTYTYETPIGAAARLSVYKRGYIRLSAGAFPPTVATQSVPPNYYRIYIGRELTANVQPEVSTFREDGLLAPSATGYHTPEVKTGTAPVTVGTFPGGSTPGQILSAAKDGLGTALLQLWGNGDWRLGGLSGTGADGRNSIWEPGDIKASMRATPSPGWLLCDGSAVSRTTYADLFAAIGTTHGVGDNSTTFNLPDARKRALYGVGSGWALGASDGEAEASRDPAGDHTHSASGVDHLHSISNHTHSVGSLSIATVADRAGGTGNRGGNPITGRTGAPDQYPNTSSMDRSPAFTTGGHSDGNPRLAANVFIKT